MTECLPDLPRYIRQRDNEWQGADHPDGPWQPIPGPQAGLPWLTDELDVPESMEPASVAAEGKPLFFAAQACWYAFNDAFNDAYEVQGPLEDMGQPIAAALRAAALYLSNDCQQLLAIAAELEGSNA